MTLILAALAFLTGTVAVGRATRLVVADTYPPMEWVRDRFLHYVTVTRPGLREWAPLVECPFCFAPYAAAVNLLWAVAARPWGTDSLTLTSVDGWWWVVNLWAAGSYLAAMLVKRDEPA